MSLVVGMAGRSVDKVYARRRATPALLVAMRAGLAYGSMVRGQTEREACGSGKPPT